MNIDLISKYKNNTFNYLVNGQGFSLEEIDCNQSKEWFCIRRNENENIVFIFDNDEAKKKNINELCNKLQSEEKKYFIYLIDLREDNNNQYNFYDNNSYTQNSRISRIIIDPVKNKLLYASSEANQIGQLLISINDICNKKNNAKSCIPFITYGIIIINVIMYLISVYMSGSISDIDSYTLYKLGAKFTYNIYNGEPWRLVTAMFLHGGAMHILCNMYSLYALGRQIEKIYGKISFTFIYLLSGIFANVLSCILSPKYLSVGASGAIFGLLGSYIVVIYIRRKNVYKSAIINLILVIFLNLYVGFTSTNIDNVAHIGGLFSGILLGALVIFIKTKKKNANC